MLGYTIALTLTALALVIIWLGCRIAADLSFIKACLQMRENEAMEEQALNKARDKRLDIHSDRLRIYKSRLGV